MQLAGGNKLAQGGVLNHRRCHRVFTGDQGDRWQVFRRSGSQFFGVDKWIVSERLPEHGEQTVGDPRSLGPEVDDQQTIRCQQPSGFSETLQRVHVVVEAHVVIR